MRLPQKYSLLLAFIALFLSCNSAFSANQMPNVNSSQLIIDQFQKTVSEAGSQITIEQSKPVQIALIYPSADVSDFWVRNYTALVKRLTELNIHFITKEFTSRQVEHSLQTDHTNTILNAEEQYDIVIFGPSELEIQAENIQRLSANTHFKTLIWAFHTPNPQWRAQPDAWFDFSSSAGAKVLCQHLVNQLGKDVFFALNRGIPGITDNQRSQEFSDCVEENGSWINMYEHFGQYQPSGGADGARLIADNFPEVTVLHNANTAMALGAIDALRELGKIDDVFVTGWGGTAKEIESIKLGEMNATPMRMSDDVGVATAEAIKYYLEGRAEAIPTIYLGRITVIDSKMPQETIDSLAEEAFRYSGLELNQ